MPSLKSTEAYKENRSSLRNNNLIQRQNLQLIVSRIALFTNLGLRQYEYYENFKNFPYLTSWYLNSAKEFPIDKNSKSNAMVYHTITKNSKSNAMVYLHFAWYIPPLTNGVTNISQSLFFGLKDAKVIKQWKSFKFSVKKNCFARNETPPCSGGGIVDYSCVKQKWYHLVKISKPGDSIIYEE